MFRRFLLAVTFVLAAIPGVAQTSGLIRGDVAGIANGLLHTCSGVYGIDCVDQAGDGDVLQKTSITTTTYSIPLPTVAQVLAKHPALLFGGTGTWAATTDPSYNSDSIVFVNGGGALFICECFEGDQTGGSTPNWGSATNPGDTVSDGDQTWVKTRIAFAALASEVPVTWQANHDYEPDVASPVFIQPTTPNGRLYLAFPLPLTSDSAEPDFDSVDFGEYVQDNDGYEMNVGFPGTSTTTTRHMTAWVPATGEAGLSVANVGANSCGTTAATIAGGASAFRITGGATAVTACRVTFSTPADHRICVASAVSALTDTIGVQEVDDTHIDIDPPALSGGATLDVLCAAFNE